MTVHKIRSGSYVAGFKAFEVLDICGRNECLTEENAKALTEKVLEFVGESGLSGFSYKLFLHSGEVLLFAERKESELILKLGLPF